jgi:3-hydroxybutyryl-CoA dehydratase
MDIGDSFSRQKTFTDDDVRQFAAITGDTNPLHLDDEYAATTQFKRRIVHGMLSASIISALLANDFPGPGTIYLGQQLKFKRPVFIGDTITCTATVREFNEPRRIMTLDTVCTNQDGTIVLEGEATVIAPSQT